MFPSSMPYDVESVRAQFPILNQEHHAGVPLIYLDNAATSQKPQQVIDALSDYYLRYNANVHRGIHKLSEEATAAYEEARLKVRRFIHASSRREIVFTRGATEAVNLVAQTWGRANLKPGDVVLSTVMEHHANIVPWQILAAEKGFTLRFIPLLENGQLDLEAYQRMLVNEPVKLVAVVHSSNVLGTINPVQEMARAAHEAGALILVDGAQSVPHMPVDVQALGTDFLVFSAHKMIGPTGIGVLYARRDLLEAMPPFLGGGDMISKVTLEGSTWNEIPYKFEAGTPSIAEAIGLGAAIDYLSALGMEQIHAHEQALAIYLMERLQEIPGLRVLGPQEGARGALAAFVMEGLHAHDVAQVLDAVGIAVRAGHHCAMPLHDYLGVNATARASLYLYNRFSEVDQLVEGIYDVRKKLAP